MRLKTLLRKPVPRFRIRTLLIATTLIAAIMPFLVSRLHLWFDTTGDGFVISGDASLPDQATFREALTRSGQNSRAMYSFNGPTTEYVDEPIRIPVFGYIQRHHKHYVCGPGANPQKQLEVTIKRSELRWSYDRHQ